MSTQKYEPISIMRNVPVIVTPQAQMILSQTNHSVEDFLEWALMGNKVSFGGNNVAVFLENKARLKTKDLHKEQKPPEVKVIEIQKEVKE